MNSAFVKLNEASLRLFKAAVVYIDAPSQPTREQVKACARIGCILEPSIPHTPELQEALEHTVGLNMKQANATLHKSWKAVRDSSYETLALQQIAHYITTYGYERMGIYSKDTVYIPDEALDLPKKFGKIPLAVIKGFSEHAMQEAIVKLASGAALAKDTIDDIMTLVKGMQLSSDIVQHVKNRELMIALHEHFGTAPTDPTEWLRYVVYIMTGETLLIKNQNLLSAIEVSRGLGLTALLNTAPDNLASIFYRFKPIFLALKAKSSNKTFFNRLRKKAKTQHVPMNDYLNDVTAHIKKGTLSCKELRKRLAKANIFRCARLADALTYRLQDPSSIVHRVRNGRAFAKDFTWEGKKKRTERALEVVYEMMARKLAHLEGKCIYIPSYVHYTVPATEKQFVGNLPTGTSIAVPKGMVVGIHWYNSMQQEYLAYEKRVDLDLSSISVDGKVGWDSAFRQGKDILFSGDMTDAPLPDGAAEMLYYRSGHARPALLYVNYYNHSKESPVRARIVVGKKKGDQIGKNHLVKGKDVLTVQDITVKAQGEVIGLVATKDCCKRVYLTHTAVSDKITSRCNKQSEQVREYLLNKAMSATCLRTVLQMAGADLVPSSETADIDLSLEKVDKATLLNLLHEAA